MTGMTQRENEKKIKEYQTTIEDAACVYVEVKNMTTDTTVSIGTLLDEGYLRKNLTNPSTKKNIEEENMRFFELGEEEEIIKIGLKSQEITMKREDFSDIQILNTSPLILITSICPNIKNDFSNLNEQRARKNK